MLDGFAPDSPVQARDGTRRFLRLAAGFGVAAAAAILLPLRGVSALSADPAPPAPPAAAAPAPVLAGDETLSCKDCHEDEEKAFREGSHRLLLRSVKGDACALCHGPADPKHPESGGKTGVTGFSKLDPDAMAKACGRCHTHHPEHVRDWTTSDYAKQGLRCSECHKVHEKSEGGLTLPSKEGSVGVAGCRVCHAPVVEAAAASIHAKVVADPVLESCEMCHVGGEGHVAAVREGGKKTPGQGFAKPMDCLFCHSTIPARHAKEMPAWAERKSAACTTCHDPHSEAANLKRLRVLGPFESASALTAAGAKPVGRAACAKCHDAPVKGFAASAHARALSERGAESCEACHGPASLHAASGGVRRLVLATRKLDADGMARFCLACHEEDAPEHATAFAGSKYAEGGKACATCHRVHAPEAAAPRDGFSTRAEAERVAKPSGSASCAKCHADPHPGLAESRHASLMTPEAAGCEGCHGPGSAHVASAGRKELILGPARLPARERDGLCLDCHRDTTSPAAWGSHSHGRAGIACFACHDPFAPPGEPARKPQPALCANCHGVEAALFRLPNAHPVGEGTMNCSDCHDLHRPPPPVKASRRWTDTCAKCHLAEASPRLHPHRADQADGCVACHEPHGTTSPRLLRFARVVDLCLSCHIPPASHDLSPGGAYASCLACHTEIHGSDADRRLLR